MMNPTMNEGLTAGFERVSAWADVLDRINVFPVADGDTGRNLVITLSPLRNSGISDRDIVRQLLIAARGNSGNIAARFLSGFLEAKSPDAIAEAVRIGRDRAWRAVHQPVPGTMLTVFDALADHLQHYPVEETDAFVIRLTDRLIDATRSTTDLLDALTPWGVVDAGALGMFLFFEGYFNRLFCRKTALRSVAAEFKDSLRVNDLPHQSDHDRFCVDSVVRIEGPSDRVVDQLAQIGQSAVVIPHNDLYKIHLHTDDIQLVREKLASLGAIVQWKNDDIGRQVKDFHADPATHVVHIMSDAAGSLTREDARHMGVTLLDSYINAGETSLPESLFDPSDLYALMRAGEAVSTSQASDFERHQRYQQVLARYDRVVYVCVGSVFTGNYQTARQWKASNDPEDRFTVIDTTAASGRLALIAMAAAHYAAKAATPQQVIDYIGETIPRCREYIFLDRLKYLARGGRLSKKNAWFGDMFNVKPIVTPTADGAVRVGQVRSGDDQILFAIDELKRNLPPDGRPVVMLEYSDNKTWLKDKVQKQIRRIFPKGRVFLQPFSLTSGVHMGPGTWAVAYLPEDFEDPQ